ncbi:hypothetical protein LINPERPRIM_LOCUS35536 [Linum perenne]
MLHQKFFKKIILRKWIFGVLVFCCMPSWLVFSLLKEIP